MLWIHLIPYKNGPPGIKCVGPAIPSSSGSHPGKEIRPRALKNRVSTRCGLDLPRHRLGPQGRTRRSFQALL